MDYIFRGKREDNGYWVYGYYCGPWGTVDEHEICDISTITCERVEVDSSTIGQQSPFRSMKDQPIFDGDILLNHDTGERLTVFWCDVRGKWMYERQIEIVVGYWEECMREFGVDPKPVSPEKDAARKRWVSTTTDELYSLVKDGVTYACEVVGDVYGEDA